MHVPLVDLKAQYRDIKEEIDEAIHRVLDHAGFILGREVEDFEEAFASYLGVRGAVGVASGTAALQLALTACGVGVGDEVITSAHTFMATGEAISLSGARPVFVDIDARTFTLDPEKIGDAVTPHTKAIIPVHLYGHPAEMDSLLKLSDRYNLRVIEDAAQAHGAEYKGRLCGSMGHLACFSFFPGKNLGAYGDAGAVTGNDPKLLSKVRQLRDHGRSSKYEHEFVGMGERLDALQAAVLRVKLRHLNRWTALRRAHAAAYNRRLEGAGFLTPLEGPGTQHAYHLYVVRAPARDRLLAHLKARNIGAGIHYPVPLHRQPAYLRLGYENVRLPVTEAVAAEVLSLPVYPEMTGSQLSYVADALCEFR